MDKIEYFLQFLENWRSGHADLLKSNGISITDFTDPLRGDVLEELVKELHQEIFENLSFEGPPGANLVLYSGEMNGQKIYLNVQEFCANSNGAYYMAGDTEAGMVLWDKRIALQMGKVVGDDSAAARILGGKNKLIDGIRISRFAIEGKAYPALDDLISEYAELIEIKKDNNIAMLYGENVKENSVWWETEYKTFVKHAGDEQRLIIVDDLQAVSKENGVVHAVPKNVQFSATARDIRLLPDEPTTRMIFDEWGHLNFLQKLQELPHESENINYIGLTFVELCAILGIVSPKYNMR